MTKEKNTPQPTKTNHARVCGLVYDNFFQKHITGLGTQKIICGPVMFTKVFESKLLEEKLSDRQSMKNLNIAHEENYSNSQKSINGESRCRLEIQLFAQNRGRLRVWQQVQQCRQSTSFFYKQSVFVQRDLPVIMPIVFAGWAFVFSIMLPGCPLCPKEIQSWKILIVDWDVHHGNGTQDIFYEDDSIFPQHAPSSMVPGNRKYMKLKGRGLGTNLNFLFRR